MNKNKSLILCTCKTKCSFYPFLLPIIFMFIRYFHEKMIEESEPPKSYKMLKYNLPYLFYLYLPKILSIILIPIIKWKLKSENNNPEQNLAFRNYHIFAKKENKKKLLLFFFIISLLTVIEDIGDFILSYFRMIEEIGWLIEKKTGFIIFVPIFSYYLLNKLIYRHHKFALILGLIGAFFVNLFRFILDFSYLNEFHFHLLNTLFSFMYSFALVLIKYVMSNFLILSPYNFLFYDGIFCIINSFICIFLEWPIIANIHDPNKLLEGENDNYLKNNFVEIFTLFEGQNKKFFIYFFLSFILSFIYYIINILTIYNFSPSFMIVLEACLPLDNDIIPVFWGKRIDNEDKVIKRTFLQLIGYIIIFIAALILNEIIILNFWELNKNIYSEISKRGIIDTSIELNVHEDVDEDDKYINESEIKLEPDIN